MERKITQLNNQRGSAMIGTLIFSVLIFGISQAFVLRTLNEAKQAKIEREEYKTFYVAESGQKLALKQLDTLINDYLQNTILQSSPSGTISYTSSQVSAGTGVDWLVYSVRDNNTPVLSQNGDEAVYSASGTTGGLSYSYTITITEKEDPVTVSTEAWDFPFSFRISSNSTYDNSSSDVVLLGDFTVRVQKDNFAKYALFTNEQMTPSGSNVWFTNNTNFSGPVHTNQRFNFAFNPSGTFYQAVSQFETHARYYNNGNTVLLNADNNGTTDVPTFQSSFSRDVPTISNGSSTQQQDMLDQSQGNGGNYNNDGIYVPTQGNTLKGGIYVKGDSDVTLSVDANNNAVYTITQGGTTKIITVDESAQSTTVNNVGSGQTNTYSGVPDGVDDAGTLIYVDGNINSLQGTVQAHTQVTVASASDVVITDNIQYANYTAGSGTPGTSGYVAPSVSGTTDNLLGIVSWNGDVRIGTAAPNDVDIHGTVLAQNGIFTVDNYTDQGVGSRGTATLLGGVITDNYGAFGLFSGSTGQHLSGYGRNFVYDSRMLQGSAPPYFPTLSTFIAFTNDITDKVVWQEGD